MRLLSSQRGVTLIELMVVVAILGILAALASVAYGRYIKSGKIERLKAIAMEGQSGQERYKSRNNAYYPAAGGKKEWPGDADEIRPLLDISRDPPADITFDIHSWAASGSCTDCAGLGAFDTTKSGFAVIVRQNLDGDTGDQTTVFVSNTSPAPTITNEGK